MLFPEEDAPLLKAWVVKRIENTSDADSEVLAEYIIALLKHDGDKKAIRELCEKEIPDFLNEDASLFLDDLFQAIAYKSYLPGAPPPPKLSAPSAAQHTSLPEPDAFQASRAPSGPRKRGYYDLDAPGGQDGSENGSRPIKNARRSGNGQPRGGAEQGRRGDHQSQAIGSLPAFDPQNPNPMEAFMALGLPLPGASPQLPSPVSSRGGRQRRRGRCRDFDTKGFCARGGTCPYDHGNEAASYAPPPTQANEEYNPQDPLLAFQAMQNFMSQFPMNFDMNTDKSRGRNNRKGGRGGRKSGARAPFSAEGPILDRSKSTIVVESIPDENFSEEEIRVFFSQFGEIQEVSMQPYKRLAIVKYDNWGSANAAYKSHKAIFDNRFVKVFWYKDEQDAAKQPGANGAKYHGDGGIEIDADVEPDIDPEEFRQRQEEAQQQFQEKEKKRAEIQRQRDELEQKQRELLDSHRQVTERLRSKLAEKNGGNGEGSAPATSAEALRATLADLESEAKMLGIDPDAADETSSSYSSGRGGYGYRGRGGFPPRGRGFRGGGRGGYGGLEGRHAAYAQYSLDNRPKRLAITGVDFSVPDTDESLRHFLLGLGEFESVEPSSSTTYVSFSDRKTAERFHQLLNGKELPGIEGVLDIQWATGPSTSTKPLPKPAVSSGTDTKKDKEHHEQEADEGGNDGISRPPRQEQEQTEMDYERPEDDDAY